MKSPAGQGSAPPPPPPGRNSNHMPCVYDLPPTVPRNIVQVAAYAAISSTGRLCPLNNPCPAHRNTSAASTPPSLESVSDDGANDDLFEAVMRLSLNSHGSEVMRATGLIAAGEFTEYDEPDLSCLGPGPYWIVWHGSDGTRFVCGVYNDWGLVRRHTNAIPGGSQKRFDDLLLLYRAWRAGWLNGSFDDVALFNPSSLGRVVTRRELIRRMVERAAPLGITIENDSRFAAEVARIEDLTDHAPQPCTPICNPAPAAAVAGPSNTQTTAAPATAPANAAPANAAPANATLANAAPTPATADTTVAAAAVQNTEPVYIVVRGRETGVFFDRLVYEEALGRHKKRWGQTAPSATVAWQRYHDLDVNGRVVEYPY